MSLAVEDYLTRDAVLSADMQAGQDGVDQLTRAIDALSASVNTLRQSVDALHSSIRTPRSPPWASSTPFTLFDVPAVPAAYSAPLPREVPIGDFEPIRDIGFGACIGILGQPGTAKTTLMLRVLESMLALDGYSTAFVMSAHTAPPSPTLLRYSDRVVWRLRTAAAWSHLLAMQRLLPPREEGGENAKHVLLLIDDLDFHQLQPAAMDVLTQIVRDRAAVRVTVVLVLERPTGGLTADLDVVLFTEQETAQRYLDKHSDLDKTQQPSDEQWRTIPPFGAIAFDRHANTFATYHPVSSQ